MKRNLILLALGLTLSLVAPIASHAEPPVTRGAVPPLVGRNLAGKRFDLESFLPQGPVIVTFWATWCRPCRKELPELQKLVEVYGERGLRVVAVNGDGPVDQAKIRPYIRAHEFDFVVIPDPDGAIRRRFQVEALPTTFLLEETGKILHRQVGYRHGDEAILKRLLEDHLAARTTPQAPAPSENDSTP